MKLNVLITYGARNDEAREKIEELVENRLENGGELNGGSHGSEHHAEVYHVQKRAEHGVEDPQEFCCSPFKTDGWVRYNHEEHYLEQHVRYLYHNLQ